MDWVNNLLHRLLQLSEHTLMENERKTLQEAQARLTNHLIVSTAEDVHQEFKQFLKTNIAKR